MPTPNVNQKIIEALRKMDRITQAMGMGPMTPPDLRRAHDRIYQGVEALRQQSIQQQVQKMQQAGSDKVVGQQPTGAPAGNLLMPGGMTPPPITGVMHPEQLNKGFHVPGRPYEQLRTT